MVYKFCVDCDFTDTLILKSYYKDNNNIAKCKYFDYFFILNKVTSQIREAEILPYKPQGQ